MAPWSTRLAGLLLLVLLLTDRPGLAEGKKKKAKKKVCQPQSSTLSSQAVRAVGGTCSASSAADHAARANPTQGSTSVQFGDGGGAGTGYEGCVARLPARVAWRLRGLRAPVAT